MRKRRMPDYIPFEIQVEIIKWLPVKSLVVSRTVSKAWKSMIDSPLFITDHTNLRRHHRLLIRYGVLDNIPHYKIEFKYVSIKDDDTLSQHTASNVPVSLGQLEGVETVGMSQGLLCLSGYNREDGCWKKRAVIWNPSLGKSIAIDVPIEHMRGVTVIGFGVHPDDRDPVVVLINCVGHPNTVMVFTLSSRIWRVPRGNLPPKSISFEYWSPVPTDDRRIYWKAFESERSINLVVAFDMVSEDFTKINLPHCLAHQKSYDFSISKIKESLALVEYYDDANKPVCGVWMMVEDGVSKSFSKLFTINTPDAPLRKKVLGFSKNDQPIMETTKDWVSASVEVYEPCTGPINNLGINGVHDEFFCCSYMESLLLLDQLNEQSVKVQLQF